MSEFIKVRKLCSTNGEVVGNMILRKENIVSAEVVTATPKKDIMFKATSLTTKDRLSGFYCEDDPEDILKQIEA